MTTGLLRRRSSVQLLTIPVKCLVVVSGVVHLMLPTCLIAHRRLLLGLVDNRSVAAMTHWDVAIS